MATTNQRRTRTATVDGLSWLGKNVSDCVYLPNFPTANPLGGAESLLYEPTRRRSSKCLRGCFCLSGGRGAVGGDGFCLSGSPCRSHQYAKCHRSGATRNLRGTLGSFAEIFTNAGNVAQRSISLANRQLTRP